MPHWWVKIESDDPGQSLDEVRGMVSGIDGVEVADDTAYEQGSQTFAEAVIEVPDGYTDAQTSELLSSMGAVDSRELSGADVQQGLLPPDGATPA